VIIVGKPKKPFLQQCNLTLDDKGLGILGTIVGKPFFKKL
jgi:hypothetical protein